MLHIAICDDDKILLDNLTKEVELWAQEEHVVCSVEPFATADAFLYNFSESQ